MNNALGSWHPAVGGIALGFWPPLSLRVAFWIRPAGSVEKSWTGKSVEIYVRDREVMIRRWRMQL